MWGTPRDTATVAGLLVLAAGCRSSGEDICDQARVRLGASVCLTEVRDDVDWEEVSVGWSDASDVLRLAPYVVPARQDARLPTLFADADAFLLHVCLLGQGFQDRFPELTSHSYPDLVLPPEGREFFAGSVHAYVNEALEPDGYGFSVETGPGPADQLTVEQARRVHQALQRRFHPGALAYRPLNDDQREAVRAWTNPGFEIREATGPVATYRPYTTGIAHGRLRILDTAGLEAATAEGSLGWQDIVVVDPVPTSVETVVAGIITAAPQDVLSHLNVLSNRRGTPNLFVAGAPEVLAAYQDRLVRLEASASHYSVVETSPAAAQAFWDERRPHAELGGPPDLTHTAMPDLSAMTVASPVERALSARRFGGKSTQLAAIDPLLTPGQRVPGFGVPLGYSDAFWRENTWSVDLPEGPATLSYRETLERWLDEPAFRSDRALRHARLTALVEHVREASVVDPATVAAVRQRITEVFGSADVMVRLRSSSNAEDGLVFNGAGLYESTRACAADDGLTGAIASACDPNKTPLGLEDGLRRVWSSLWSPRAFEEREYYQLDQLQVHMGVLVSERFEAELANGVAVTGNPVDPSDARFLVNAQVGETSVVQAPAGVVGEVDALTVTDNGFVAVERLQRSSLLPDGGFVLSNGQLSELGRLLDDLHQNLTIDGAATSERPVLLELEFKIDAAGNLRIKQARPFQTGGENPLAVCQLLAPD